MGRTAKFDREHAIEIAMREIWQKGYEACSVKAISEKLAITRSSFYHAFGSREALFKEALEKYFEQSPAYALHAASDSVLVKPLLTRTFKHICIAAASDTMHKGCMLVNCTAELANVHPDLTPYLAEANQAITQRFEHLIEQAVRQQEINPDTPVKATAMVLQNLLNGIYMTSKIEPGAERLWSLAHLTLSSINMYTDDD